MKFKVICLFLLLVVVTVPFLGCDYITGVKPEGTAPFPLKTFVIPKPEVVGLTEHNYPVTVSAVKYQDIIDAFKNLQYNSQFSEKTCYAEQAYVSGQGLSWNSCIKGSGWFDINQYFTALTHLSMESGYTMDYVYFTFGSGALPLPYVRKTEEKPLKNFEEFLTYFGDAGRIEMVCGVLDRENPPAATDSTNSQSFDDKIRLDGTPESYFEFLAFEIMGGQFYQEWHALTDDMVIVCDASDLANFLPKTESNIWGVPADVLEQARSLDFEPQIEFKVDTVEISVITYSAWTGFDKVTCVIRRNAAHNILDIQRENLVPYNCGITF